MKKIIRKNKGITLIALVITIIVLLILAGVAIAMLSGENGILKKATEAKTKTEGGQKQEETALATMELTTYFVTNNLRYKCNNGYITGFKNAVDDNGEVRYNLIGESIEDFEGVLGILGYKVGFRYDAQNKKDVAITDSEKTEKITTGMAITKGDKIVARTVVFGDNNCDGLIDSEDADNVNRYCNFIDNINDFQKIACDVNQDGKIDDTDAQIILDTDGFSYELEQSKAINIAVKNIKRSYESLQDYIKLLDKSTGYTFEYNSETDSYKLKGVKANTTVEELINALPNSTELKVYNKKLEMISNEQVVQDGYYLQRKFDDNGTNVSVYFATIEIEK